MNKQIVCIIMLLGILSGCSGARKAVVLPTKSVAPWWIVGGDGWMNGPRGKGYYAVGLVSNVVSPSLRWRAADSAARAAMAKTIKTEIAGVYKSYLSEYAGEGSQYAKKDVSQSLLEANVNRYEGTLYGFIIVDRWTDPEDNSEYVLGMIDLDGYQQFINDQKKLPADVRERIEKNAKEEWDKIEKRMDVSKSDVHK